MSIYDDDNDDIEDEKIDLNPHKPKLPPLPPAPDGYAWTGFHPNMELVPIEELGERFRKTLERRANLKANHSEEEQ